MEKQIIELGIEVRIKDKFGSVNQMFETKPFTVSRQHLYRVINGEVSTSVAVANDLANALELDLVVVHNLLLEARKVYKDAVQ